MLVVRHITIIYVVENKKASSGQEEEAFLFSIILLRMPIYSIIRNLCCIPAGRGSIQQGSVRPDHHDVGVSSNADAQTDKNHV